MIQSFFARRRGLIILVMTFLLPFIWMGTRRALRSNRNDVKEWLPEDFPETADHRWFQEHFPYEQFVLCSWDGCTLDDQRLELLAKKLVPEPPEEEVRLQRGARGAAESPPASESEGPRYFKSVLTGPRLVGQLQERYPSLSDEEIYRRLEGSLIGKDHDKTCLVVTLTDAAKGKNLRSALEKIRELARQCNIEPPAEAKSSNFFVRAWDAVILTAREMIYGRDPPNKGIYMGGPPVDNVAIDVEGERTLMRLAGLSAIIGLGISMACFRSFRLTLMVFWTALLAAGTGLALVFFTGSRVDAIMLSMPSLVYVLAISGAVHIINYYHDAVRERGLRRAPERALGHGWFPCTMAAVTTAIGLGSLLRSHVVPISKFGVYSALGVLSTLGFLFLLLPALLSYFPSRRYAERHGGEGDTPSAETILLRWWRMAGGFIIRRNVAVSVVCLLLMLLLAVPLVISFAQSRGALAENDLPFDPPRIRTSVKLMKFFSPDAEIIHHYRWLEHHLGPLVPMEVVLKVDNANCRLSFLDRMRLAQQVEHTVEELDAVGGALSAATFAPDLYLKRRRVSVFERMAGLNERYQREKFSEELNKRLQKHRPDFRDYLAMDGNPGLAELGITGRLASRLAARELDSLERIERYGDPQKSIAANLGSVKGIRYDEGLEVQEAVERWQAEHGVELWRITARVEALSDLDYAKFVEHLKQKVEPLLAAHQARGVEGVEAVYTGLVPLVYKTQHELMRGLLNSLTMAFLLIALVMMFVLKSPTAGLLSMIPNVFPVVVIFGVMGWSGILVDAGTMMTASVALGVAVDDTMHYLTWFRQGLDEGRDRKGAAMMAYERCGTAMTQTTLIGGLGLAAFCFSTFTPTQRFGTFMLLLLFAALFGDLVFLPAMLTSPLGRVFRRRPRKPAEPLPAEEVPEEEVEEEVVAVPGEPVTPKPHIRPGVPHRTHGA